jgi:hypothetical protein
MSKIVDFFDQLSTKAKFMTMKDGRTLADSNANQKPSNEPPQQPAQPRREPPQTTSKAAQAAMERSNAGHQKPQKKSLQEQEATSLQRSDDQIPRGESSSTPQPSASNSIPPEIPSLESLPVDNGKNNSTSKAINYLKRYGDDLKPGSLEPCIELLNKYADNILNNPTDVKYRKIKMSNKIFAEKVKPVPGAIEILKAAGFEEVTEEIDGNQETFLIFPADREDHYLTQLKQFLNAPLSVDRDIRIFAPIKAANILVPEDTYQVSAAEIKEEQLKRKAQIELMQTLRTKEMRDKDEMKNHKNYKVTKVRIRFPTGEVLQGNFASHEDISALLEFAQFCLEEQIPSASTTTTETEPDFYLVGPSGETIDGKSKGSLLEAGYAPSVLLNLRWRTSKPRYALSPSLLTMVEPL